MGSIDLFKKSFGKEHIAFPEEIKNSSFIKKLDRALDNRNPYIISLIFKWASSDKSIDVAEKLVNSSLNEKRNLQNDDLDLIKEIVSAYKNTKKFYIIFNSVGNLLFIAKLIDELKKRPRLNSLIKITCFLWLYQNIVEIIYAHISELFYVIAKHRKDQTYVNSYNDAVKKEEHLMRGQLYDYAKKNSNKFTSDKKKTFLHKNILRDRLAHANCFYDPDSKEIILETNKRLTLEEFKIEFAYVKDFLNELLFQLNNNQSITIKKELVRLSKKYQRMGRKSNQVTYFKTKYKFIDS